MPPLTVLGAFAELESKVEAFLGSGNESELLSAVFKLNNEIGKLLRLSRDPALKELQLRVNEVTVAAKKRDRKRLRVALERVRDSVADLKEGQ